MHLYMHVRSVCEVFIVAFVVVFSACVYLCMTGVYVRMRARVLHMRDDIELCLLLQLTSACSLPLTRTICTAVTTRPAKLRPTISRDSHST